MNCKCCGCESVYLDSIKKMDFDGSVFNHDAKFFLCPTCGFLETKSPFSDSDNSDHYASHVLYHSMSGVGVGGDSSEDLIRYERYKNLLGDLKGMVVDVGCSRGGFLKWLSGNTIAEVKLIGVDVDTTSLQISQKDEVELKVGNAFSLPLSDNSIDILTYFHVWEHIDDLDALLCEAMRALKEEGTILVEVPNADRYDRKEDYVGVGFWMYMQEHLNHFSLLSIYKLLQKHGLCISEYVEQTLPMKSGFGYPSLMVRINKTSKRFSAQTQYSQEDYLRTKSFVSSEIKRSQQMSDYCLQQTRPLVFWGIGLEFFNIFSKMKISEKDNIQLVDSNKEKQRCTVMGINVLPPEKVTPSGTLIIASYMVPDVIKEEAVKLGWPLDRIIILSEIQTLN